MQPTENGAARPLVYIASPLRGDVEQNIENAMRYCAGAVEAGYLPIAPHAMYRGMWNDEIPAERQTALEIGLQLLEKCQRVWVCGDRVSAGMQGEIELAQRLGKPVEYKPETFFQAARPAPNGHRSFSELRQEVAARLEEKQRGADGIKELLILKARYLPYSLETAMAIHLQSPQAQHVATYQEWNRLGCRILDQESIKVWVPVQRTCFERDGKQIDAREATAGEREDIMSGKLPVKEAVFYRMSLVYDIAQTDCPRADYERVMGNPYLHLDYQEKYQCMQAAAHKCGMDWKESGEPMAALMKGAWSENEIIISDRIHPAEKLSAFCAAFAQGLVELSSSQPPHVRRFEADALSFLLQSRLGIPDTLKMEDVQGERETRREIARQPGQFEASMPRIQRMLRHTDKRVQESMKELGLAPEQELGLSAGLTQAQREVNRNFMQDIG